MIQPLEFNADIAPTIACQRQLEVNVMSANNLEDMENEHQKPEVLSEFVCIDPAQTAMVLQAVANFDQELDGPTLAHLDLCLHCCEQAEAILANYRPSARRTVRPALKSKSQSGCTSVVTIVEVPMRAEARLRSN